MDQSTSGSSKESGNDSEPELEIAQGGRFKFCGLACGTCVWVRENEWAEWVLDIHSKLFRWPTLSAEYLRFVGRALPGIPIVRRRIMGHRMRA